MLDTVFKEALGLRYCCIVDVIAPQCTPSAYSDLPCFAELNDAALRGAFAPEQLNENSLESLHLHAEDGEGTTMAIGYIKGSERAADTPSILRMLFPACAKRGFRFNKIGCEDENCFKRLLRSLLEISSELYMHANNRRDIHFTSRYGSIATLDNAFAMHSREILRWINQDRSAALILNFVRTQQNGPNELPFWQFYEELRGVLADHIGDDRFNEALG